PAAIEYHPLSCLKLLFRCQIPPPAILRVNAQPYDLSAPLSTPTFPVLFPVFHFLFLFAAPAVPDMRFLPKPSRTDLSLLSAGCQYNAPSNNPSFHCISMSQTVPDDTG